ncbi:asparagine synthase [Anabaena cylindrica FACHB-243]|uniref:asparagine synthase (glutamine-hydrolyzing) n=1 Tax=Anabaena cylindrica (strain ATCC 27899 / PCC 7122) TaxID=272123 RepID=K9ZDW0_ANACC|nr:MULTISPECIES: asparagine synthetase B family protein [Anabaena]AFZ57398.1 asparagine synthase [Anabaena cylindrica PCC 7122]MBD2421080.1 asparagine synthase [Anabaena cylindrica FACHB-243]MBY5284946.1 asparagine synthase [Anabaena sp. CCAP 1446/1C]MBY5306350.1 asparagine synthase [Anabaena sp. CCAP 1446/1C]MCM2405833.1 asparagine synthetase B family protein [Anabaena sp. CCAP 1446/1C]
MLFNFLKPPKSVISGVEIKPSWCVGWGRLGSLTEDVIWQDEQFAVISAPAHLAISPTKRFVVVGDVWLSNRGELLRKLGIEINDHCTNQQLVAQLWEKYGSQCLTLLVGMFGLVIWDCEQQILWLGRDRIGSQTLYYTTTGLTRWIAPKLITLNPFHSNDLDLVALRDYLCCAFVPGERTLWQNVREMRPGTLMQMPTERIYHYWQLQEQITDSNQPLEWYSTKLRSLLEQVVQEYLPQNEPIGIFLSGGLDSSSITALAAKLHTAPVHTYSIYFGTETANELEFSNLVAQHCQTQHHILEITFRDMWERLPETMAYLDDPIGDPLTVPNLLLGRMARENVQITLNGEGGDPCFGGPKNQPMLINSLYGSVNKQDSLQAYLFSFQKCALDLSQLLKPKIWQSLKNEPSIFSADLNSNANYLNRLMALNIKFKGADQILTKVNNLTQAADLQGFSPLFDQRIVELSMQIPPEYKLSGVEEKAVLKKAVSDILPDTIIHRPKSGMMVPVQLGFKKYWQREARTLLLNRNSAISPYINRDILSNWLDFKGDVWGRYGVKLWLLVSLEIWLQVNKSVFKK